MYQTCYEVLEQSDEVTDQALKKYTKMYDIQSGGSAEELQFLKLFK